MKIDLSIEIGDKENDFNDMLDTIPKGQFVTYQIHIKNTGNTTYHDLVTLMDSPDYMTYVPGSVYKKDSSSAVPVLIEDINGISPLEIGYQTDSMEPDSEMFFTAEYQVDKDILDEQVFTVAWANLLDEYSSAPMVSNLIENKISGVAAPALQIIVDSLPVPNSKVGPGFRITYTYTIKNLGGVAETNVNLITYLPANTTCVNNCGSMSFNILNPNEFVTVTMMVEVNADYGSAKTIEDIGFNYSGKITGTIENRTPVIHIIDSATTNQEGNFTVDIIQKPNIVLNSSDGINARDDKSDLTETLYTLTYKGLQKFNTYPTLSTAEPGIKTDPHCGTFNYPQAFGATTYAYNSNGGGCDNIYGCPPTSSPILFNVNTTLPTNAPKLDFTINTPAYTYGSTPEVNSYMKNGGAIQIPSIFTQSRAFENGSMGIVSTAVTTNVTEDMYRYDNVGTTLWCRYTVSCGKFSCSYANVYRPVYQWNKVSSQPITLSDNDNTDITVYTSTAWLKTQGGNIGTNDQLTNGAYTDANYGDLGNPKVSDYFTPSSNYTPPGETNGDYMIFGKNGTGTFKSKSGDSWLTDGAEFPFLEKGDAYDRKDNPRDYYQDMFSREKFGEVKENKLPSKLSGTVDLGDNIIWKNSEDIIIGTAGTDDTVTLAGGRSRIYTDGDVYINANIRYNSSQGENYNDITSVRIDARNIYVNGEVTDLEVMLLARDTFKSGVSRNQLRVLGDVIANNTVWEREPLLEDKPTEFNKPSEYIIEDMRKYVLPPPGDTEIPDDYNVWRQVNPSTGEVLDGY
jgi:uncharacterized repeat protein (TIGR01451 family)